MGKFLGIWNSTEKYIAGILGLITICLAFTNTILRYVFKYSPEWMQTLIKNRDRANAAPTFSAAGLYLAGVSYDPKWKLPSFEQLPFMGTLPMISR